MEKKTVFLVVGIIAICLILLVIFIINRSKPTSISYNQVQSGDIILSKTTYNYPHKTSMLLYKDGKVMQSTIIDELTVNGAPEENYKELKKINKDDEEKIIQQINEMKTNEASEYSNNYYGIAINVDGDMMSAGYYNQTEIDKLNNLINELIYNN